MAYNPYGTLTNYNRGQRYAGGTAGDIAGLGDALASAVWMIKQKRDQDKLDELANHLANSTPELGMIPHAGDVAAGTEAGHPFNGGAAGLDLILGAKMKQMQIAKSLQGPVPKAGVVKPAPVTVETTYGPMRPKDAAANDRGWQNQQRLWEQQGNRGEAKPLPAREYDSFERLGKDVETTTGNPLSYFTNLSDAEKHIEGTDFWTGTYAQEDDKNAKIKRGDPQKKITFPADTYRDFLARYQAIQSGKPRPLGGGAAAAPGPGMSGHAVGSHEDNLAPSAATAPGGGAPAVAASPADAIRQQYRAGQISKEEAAAQLRNLGFN